MSKVSVSQVLSADANKVWSLVGDPAGFAAWHPAVAASRMREDGKTREVTLADGGELREEITAHDDGSRQYTYRIVESPLPITGYTSTLRVTAEGDRARVTWDSEFEVVGAPTAEVVGMIRGLYEAGLGHLASAL